MGTENSTFDESSLLPVIKNPDKEWNEKMRKIRDGNNECIKEKKEEEVKKHKRSARMIEIEKRHGINYTYIPPELRNPKK